MKQYLALRPAFHWGFRDDEGICVIDLHLFKWGVGVTFLHFFMSVVVE